jgi:hypothetical protein
MFHFGMVRTHPLLHAVQEQVAVLGACVVPEGTSMAVARQLAASRVLSSSFLAASRAAQVAGPCLTQLLSSTICCYCLQKHTQVQLHGTAPLLKLLSEAMMDLLSFLYDPGGHC